MQPAYQFPGLNYRQGGLSPLTTALTPPIETGMATYQKERGQTLATLMALWKMKQKEDAASEQMDLKKEEFAFKKKQKPTVKEKDVKHILGATITGRKTQQARMQTEWRNLLSGYDTSWNKLGQMVKTKVGWKQIQPKAKQLVRDLRQITEEIGGYETQRLSRHGIPKEKILSQQKKTLEAMEKEYWGLLMKEYPKDHLTLKKWRKTEMLPEDADAILSGEKEITMNGVRYRYVGDDKWQAIP